MYSLMISSPPSARGIGGEDGNADAWLSLVPRGVGGENSAKMYPMFESGGALYLSQISEASL